MRRVLTLILCLGFLTLPAQAAGGQEYVALTFDDGPSGRFTRRLLDGLQERGVEATFLLCGYRMEQYPDITQRMVDEGHEIGLHGYSHKSMKDMSRRDIAQELSDCQALLPRGYVPQSVPRGAAAVTPCGRWPKSGVLRSSTGLWIPRTGLPTAPPPSKKRC